MCRSLFEKDKVSFLDNIFIFPFLAGKFERDVLKTIKVAKSWNIENEEMIVAVNAIYVIA